MGVVVARQRIGAASEGAGPVVGVGHLIVIRGAGVRATREEAGAVIVVGPAVVVRRQRIGAAGVQTGPVVDGRKGVVVAGQGVGTAREDARTIVEFSRRIIVGGRLVGTASAADDHHAQHAELGLVGDGRVVVVDPRDREGEGAEAGAFGRTEHGGNREGLGVVKGQTRDLVSGGVDVVQSAGVDPDHGGPNVQRQDARIEVKAAGGDHGIGFNTTGVEIHTATILFGGGGVVVPSGVIRAPEDFLLVTGAVAVGVGQTVSIAIPERRSEDAAAIVVVGGLVVIAGRRIGTAPIEAGAVIHGRTRVVVVRSRIGTPPGARAVGAFKAQMEPEVGFTHSVFEDLDEQRARNLTVRGQLCQQHFLVVARKTVAVVLGHKPGTARGVVHDDVAPVLKRNVPALQGALDRADIALIGRTVGLLEDADGHPAVVFELREEAKKQRIHSIGGRRTEVILVERRGRGEVHREDGVSTHRRHDVIGVHAIHVDAVRGHAGKGAGVMFGQHLNGQAIAADLGVAAGGGQQTKEKGGQTVHVSTIWVGQS